MYVKDKVLIMWADTDGFGCEICATMASEIEDSGGLSFLEERLNDEGYKNWLKVTV